MKTNFKKTLAVTALALCGGLYAVSSQAVPVAMNATMGITSVGTSVYSGADLNSATTFTFGTALGANFVITSIPPLAFGNPNDFSGGLTPVTLFSSGVMLGNSAGPTLNISAFAPITNFMTWSSTGGDVFKYTLNTLTRNSSALGAMDLFGIGTVTDSLGNYNPSNPASIRLTAQELAGTTTWSASWASPPAVNNVPEPYFMSLLGLGLAAFGFSRRRSLLRSEGQSA